VVVRSTFTVSPAVNAEGAITITVPAPTRATATAPMGMRRLRNLAVGPPLTGAGIGKAGTINTHVDTMSIAAIASKAGVCPAHTAVRDLI
jgi:hypothetical protein